MKGCNDFQNKITKRPIKNLSYTTDQIEIAVRRVYDVVPDNIGYHLKGCIFITYSVSHKLNPQQIGRISRALIHLTDYLAVRVIHYYSKEEVVIELHQDKCYPLQLLNG
jgi:hypothetical protein